MVDPRECQPFFAEALACFLAGERALGQHFDRNVTLEMLVPGAVNLPHAAGADLFEDVVVGEPLANHRTSLALAMVLPRFAEAMRRGGTPFLYLFGWCRWSRS